MIPWRYFFYTGSGDGGGGGRELDGQTGRPVATGADSRAVPSDITGVAGQTEHVSGGVRVDGPGQVVLAPVDQARPVRPDGNGELQLAAGHVVPSVVRQGAQPVAVALLASVFLRAASKRLLRWLLLVMGRGWWCAFGGSRGIFRTNCSERLAVRLSHLSLLGQGDFSSPNFHQLF